ncbi:MAG TPA: hypothetical protein VI750_12450 [Pyrinomonadaceae bacterium]|nr:hypothetical protein [Pyrinomonadaceae bacterium]
MDEKVKRFYIHTGREVKCESTIECSSYEQATTTTALLMPIDTVANRAGIRSSTGIGRAVARENNLMLNHLPSKPAGAGILSAVDRAQSTWMTSSSRTIAWQN